MRSSSLKSEVPFGHLSEAQLSRKLVAELGGGPSAVGWEAEDSEFERKIIQVFQTFVKENEMKDRGGIPYRKTQRTLDWEEQQAKLEALKPSFRERVEMVGRALKDRQAHLRKAQAWSEHLEKTRQEQAQERPTRDPKRTLTASLQAIIDGDLK